MVSLILLEQHNIQNDKKKKKKFPNNSLSQRLQISPIFCCFYTRTLFIAAGLIMWIVE
jgi:hypothetical protein